MKITERRLIVQEWEEDEEGDWVNLGWEFKDDGEFVTNDWTIVEIIDSDKFYNPILAIAERETNI